MRKLLVRIKFWIVSKIMKWEEYWDRNIPEHERLQMLQKRYGDKYKYFIDKNLTYWESIETLRHNTPFLNEMAELQDKYDNRVRESLLTNDMENAKIFSAIHRGTKEINAIIIKAIKEVNNAKSQNR